MRKSNSNNNRSIRTKNQHKLEIKRWAEIIKVKPQQIRIQKMTRKWASCSTKKRVSFNINLLKETRGFQNFVIIHELLHLQIPNHGKLFKSMMNVLLPDWKNTLKNQNTKHIHKY